MKHRLYIEYDKKYKEEEIKEKERQKMERLEAIKNLYRPLTKEELDEHTKKYDDLMKQKREEYRRKRGDLDISRNYDSSDGAPPKRGPHSINYKSKFHDMLLQEDRDFKESYHLRKK